MHRRNAILIWILATAGMLLSAAPRSSAGAERHELSNQSVRVVFDNEGRLLDLTNLQTGHAYLGPGARHAPWRMYYRWNTPLDGALELEIPTDGQKGRVRRERNSLEISYESLTGAVPQTGKTRELQIGLRVTVTLEGDRLIWTGRINNREQDQGVEVTELWLPWMYGIGNMGMGPGADALYWPSRGGRRIEAPYVKLAAAAGTQAQPTGFGSNPTWSYSDTGAPEYRLTYPYPACMQWYTINNGAEGLYIGSHDKTLMTTVLDVASDALKGMSASIVKFPFVKGGETWDSEPVVVRLYRGDWHEAARTYRAWAETWMQKPDPPEWVRRTPGWIMTTPKGQSGRIRSTYAELPGMVKQAQAAGISLLNVFGWVKEGFDSYYPEYSPDEAMGGEAGLRKALADIKEAGGRTFLYTQGQLIDPASQWYKNGGYRVTAKDIWGYEYRETYGGSGSGAFMGVMRNKWFGVACPAAPGWADQLVSQANLVLDLGAQGAFFDQLGGAPPYICFSKEHNHTKPSLAVAPWKVKNLQRLREVIKARGPNAVLSFELVSDCYSGWADIVHSEGVGFHVAPESFGEMYRYTFPSHVITNRPIGSPEPDRRKQLGKAFSLGLRFDSGLRDLQNHGLYYSRLLELYNTHADLLLEGRFVDNEGFLCDNNQVSSHAFVAGNRLAVTLWNPTDVAQRARVVADGYQLEAAKWQDPSLSGPGQWVMPGDVAVLIFRRP
ncbi:MAG TPA: DUF6259 domain-containing protein [Bryobacteraceae bacterium]|nr:DUF6259 domain-containing protein [Bryobacteraceae bacterium]